LEVAGRCQWQPLYTRAQGLPIVAHHPRADKQRGSNLMTIRFYRRLAATATVLMLSSLRVLAAEPCGQQGEPGDVWEATSQMSIEGMPMSMPARTTKVCSPKEWTQPPGASDEQMKCKTSDFMKVGAKVTWKVVCAGPPEMTGAGEITRNGADSYTGTIRFTSSEASMTTTLSGRRVGACELPRK